MFVLVFGSDVDQLRRTQALIAPDVALLRDPNVWQGEVEPFDAVLFLDVDTRADLVEAYKDVYKYTSTKLTNEPKPERKKRGAE